MQAHIHQVAEAVANLHQHPLCGLCIVVIELQRVEELNKLDPEKGIWCIYDSYALIDLVPDTTATEEEAEQFKNEGMEIGDYIINAW